MICRYYLLYISYILSVVRSIHFLGGGACQKLRDVVFVSEICGFFFSFWTIPTFSKQSGINEIRRNSLPIPPEV